MKTTLPVALLALTLCPVFCPLRGADDARVAALEAADDARIAAVRAADAVRLGAILSDELHYGHSSGAIETKAMFIDALVSGRIRYVAYEHQDRTFSFPAPGIALMSGRAHVKVETASGGMDAPVGYLAVWREENGSWRFLAWQACRIVTPAR